MGMNLNSACQSYFSIGTTPHAHPVKLISSNRKVIVRYYQVVMIKQEEKSVSLFHHSHKSHYSSTCTATIAILVSREG